MNPLSLIRETVVSKSIDVVLSAYNDIINSKKFETGNNAKEDVRRNQIVKTILANKAKYKFEYIVAMECSTYNEDCVTIGRMDICIYYSSNRFEQKSLSFECKRYLKSNSGTSAIEKTLYDEGINRYITGKYPCDTGVGCLIAFCESGNYKKLSSNINSVLTNHSVCTVFEDSAFYKHNFVYSTYMTDCKKQKIKIVVILMDFS